MNPSFKKFSLIILSILFVFGAWLRLDRIMEIGISAPDGFFYWETATEWLNGHPTLTEHFRPFIYWLDSKILALLGVNDWSLRFFNAACDIGVAGIIIWIGVHFKKDVLLGLSASVSYLYLLEPLLSARGDTVHSPSTLFVSLSILSLLYWLKNLKSYNLLFSGLFLGLAWLTHPDLAVLGLAGSLSIFYKQLISDKFKNSNFWYCLIKNQAIYIFGYFLVFILFIFYFDLESIFTSFLVNHKAQTKMIQHSFIWRLGYFSYHYIKTNMGILELVLWIISLFIIIKNSLRKKVSSIDLTIALYPTIFLIMCALLFARILLPRLLLPLIPFIVLTIFIQISSLHHKFKHHVLLSLVFISLSIHHQTILFPQNEPVSIYKKIDQTFSPLLKKNSKLLIAPFTIYHIHTPLSKKVYLSGVGHYLISYDEPSLDVLFKKENFTHVWISDVLYDERILGKNFKEQYQLKIKNLYSMDKQTYDVILEKNFLRQLLSKNNYKLIHQSNLGELYQLEGIL
jgi:hypothetical protein